jgi:transcription-repair coupling factor (superfamily II helicase)
LKFEIRGKSVVGQSEQVQYENQNMRLLNARAGRQTVSELMERIRHTASNIFCTGLSGSEQAYAVHRIHKELKASLLVAVDGPKKLESFIKDLSFFAGGDRSRIYHFPPYNLLPYKTLSYHSETATQRIRTFFRLTLNPAPFILVTTVGGMMHNVMPKNEMVGYAELVMAGEDTDRDQLVEKLIAGGYLRTGVVEEPGDFCVRGGILDIFSPMYDDPLRIEFFGDTVESLRFFSAESQRKLKNVDEAVILPAKEIILKKSALTGIIARIRERAAALEIPVTQVREIVERIAKEGIFPGLESLTPVIYPELDTLVDYLPANTQFIQIEPADLDHAADAYASLIYSNHATAREAKKICVEPQTLYTDWQKIKKNLGTNKTLLFGTLEVLKPEENESEKNGFIQFAVEDNTDLVQSLKYNRGKDNPLYPLFTWISSKKEAGFGTWVICPGEPSARRTQSLLAAYGIEADVVDAQPDFHIQKGATYICIGHLSSGFVWPEERLAVITGDEIFGKKYQQLKPSKTGVRTDLITVEDLKTDDLVVHADHGIGRYGGLAKLRMNGSTNDFLLILYKDDDKLYLPVDRMGLIQKYMGVDGITPVLDKLGGKTWDRIKSKVKKSAEKIAGELLKLYAERKVQKGFAFEDVDAFYRDFESGFPYEETPDQIAAINHVIQDMMDDSPMDRLVCGDVGYGKTEVALRASFFAAQNGKQVAVLVPTTVLAEQHFSTFSSRLDDYPVSVACLSRFRSPKEQKRIIDDLAAGKIDIVIGTHRLLQKDVAFKELGLFIIDEEQRFGVKHKEKLKKIRSTVDVLALTATPIPRTLHLSLLGIRDISLISTPPEYRRAIITYVSEFEDAVVAEAIRKELGRGGQIFFVHNNIHSIYNIAGKIKKLVPEIRMDVAHGRMKEEALEAAMYKFVKKEIDLLVCTTIIESGLDIPAANTILVNRADKFGLAQIYQLRGRVGRGDEQAYAYLFIPKESALGKDAQKRLKVLMEHSDLGAGFQIAMSDLKIRGGGTILGASQSGHIASVGYDMFLKLMEESIAEIKGEPIREPLEPEINIVMSAFIPESYVSDIDQRLSSYRRLARMSDLKDISDFKAEMTDRFGPLPVEASNLLLKIMLRVLAQHAGVKRLDLNGRDLVLFFSQAHQKNPYGIAKMVADAKSKFQINSDNTLKTVVSNQNFSGILAEIKNILKEIARHVNPDTH